MASLLERFDDERDGALRLPADKERDGGLRIFPEEDLATSFLPVDRSEFERGGGCRLILLDMFEFTQLFPIAARTPSR